MALRVMRSDRGYDTEGNPGSLWYTIHRASQAMTNHETQSLKSTGLTITQYVALMGLSFSLGQSSAHMARCLGVTPQATNALTHKLAKGGLIQREPDPYAAAVVINSLTPEGRKLVEEADTRLLAIERQRRATLGPASFDRLLAILKPAVRLTSIEGTPEQIEALDRLQALVRTRLGGSVRNLDNHHTHDVQEALRRSGIDLTPTQFAILDLLKHGAGMPSSHLISQAGITHQGATTALVGLGYAGLVAKEPAPNRPGWTLTSLTDAGVALRDQARGELRACFDWPDDGTTEEDFEFLIRMLEQLAE